MFDLPLFAYILVFAQIVLEVLPVSSTGHLKLIKLFFNLQSFAGLDVLLDCVNLVSDFVVGLFFLNKTHFKLFSLKPHIIKETLNSGSVFITYAIVSNACTAFIYLLLDRYSCSSLSLIYGFAISFLLVSSSYFKDRFFDNKIESLDLKKALIIGVFQSLAICFRGVSRFGTTFVVARWLNLNVVESLFFTFIMHAQISCAILFHHFLSGKLVLILDFLKDPILWAWLLLGGIASYIFLLFVFELAVARKFYFFSFVYLFSIILLLKSCF